MKNACPMSGCAYKSSIPSPNVGLLCGIFRKFVESFHFHGCSDITGIDLHDILGRAGRLRHLQTVDGNRRPVILRIQTQYHPRFYRVRACFTKSGRPCPWSPFSA